MQTYRKAKQSKSGFIYVFILHFKSQFSSLYHAPPDKLQCAQIFQKTSQDQQTSLKRFKMCFQQENNLIILPDSFQYLMISVWKCCILTFAQKL